MQRFWSRVAGVIARWPGTVLAAALALTAIAAVFAIRLRVDTDLWRLLPPSFPSYQALQQLRTTVGGENPLDVVIESPSFEANRRFAEALVPAALALRDSADGAYFDRAAFRRDVDFLRRNALYFATDAELDSLTGFLDDLTRAVRREANPLTRSSSGREAAETALGHEARRIDSVWAGFIGTEYPMSADSTLMVVRLYPTSSQGDLGFVAAARAGLEGLIRHLGPETFQPGMTARLSGRFLQEELEAATIQHDVRLAAGWAIPAVLLSVVLYFWWAARARLASEVTRLPILALVAGIPLAMSITWTYGLAWLAFRTLNVVTTTLGLVLFGMGVDYGIHFLAAYADARGGGARIGDAVRRTYDETARAVGVSALTTAAGLYVLLLADFRGFREFGFLTGTGMLLGFVAMFVVLPALTVLADRRGLLFSIDPAGGRRVRRLVPLRPAVALGVGALITAVALLLVPRVRFEYNTSRLQPDFPEYHALRAKVSEVFPSGGRTNPAYIIADQPEDVVSIVRALRSRLADRGDTTVLAVEALQDRLPLTPAAQVEKLQRLAAIRARLDGPVLSRVQAAALDTLRRAASTTIPPDLSRLPPSLTAPFLTRDGRAGNLILIYPARTLGDARNSMAFGDAVGTFRTPDGRTWHAASLAIVAGDMIRLMQSESLTMVALSLGLITLLMLVTFRSFRWASVALVPTVVGVLWMLGLMVVLDVRLSFYNLAVLPIVLGVGNDAGVHLAHAARHAGALTERAMWAAGGRVFVAVFTTMLGFGGLLFTHHPGIASIGTLAVLGLGTTLAATLLLVPALVRLRGLPPARPADSPS